MKHFILAFYVFIIIFCQVILYRSRKPLAFKEKQYDVNLWSLYDTITLSFLLISYIVLYLIPYPPTLWGYAIIAIIIGIILQYHYYKKLTPSRFPKRFRVNSAISLALQYYSTVTLGFGLIIFYNLA